MEVARDRGRWKTEGQRGRSAIKEVQNHQATKPSQEEKKASSQKNVFNFEKVLLEE